MNKENMDLIRVAASEAGDFLKGKLKPLPDVPVRNSYAHVWRTIKNTMGKSYKECSDEDAPRILELIKETRDEVQA